MTYPSHSTPSIGPKVAHAALPTIENYDKLVPIAHALYQHTSHLAWQMLLPLFLLSVAIGYSTELGVTGSVIVRLKRLVLVMILLVAFPTLAELCQNVGVEIAKSIDNMAGIDMILRAAAAKAHEYSFNLSSLLNMGNDLVMALFVTGTYILLVLARYFLLAFQHFFWLVLVTTGPFLILATLFESASGVTRALFKSMIQVSCWPIIWAILSAFLKALPFSHTYYMDPNQITVITLNLIIAIALLFSPFLVSHFTEGVIHTGAGEHLRRHAVRAATVGGGKVLFVTKSVASAATRSTRDFNPARFKPGSKQ